MERKEIQSDSGIAIQYERPISTNRLYSAVVDFFLAVVIILLLVFASNAIVKTTDFYKNNQGFIDEVKVQSRLYSYDATDTLRVVTDTVVVSGDQSASIVKTKLTRVLEGDEFAVKAEDKYGFFDYCYLLESKNPADLDSFYVEHRDAYDKERLEVLNPDNAKPMFEYVYNDDGTVKYYEDIIYDFDGKVVAKDLRPLIIENGNGKMDDYNEYFYRPFIKRCPNSLIRIPGYFESTQSMSAVMLGGLIPGPIILGIIIVYFVPGLIFRRGRKSIGKLIFKIGILDKTGYNVSLGRYCLRSLIILAECVLFLPAVISLTMLIFTKKMSNLHDLILKMNVVETKVNPIYFDKLDAYLGQQKAEKKPIDFKAVDIKR